MGALIAIWWVALGLCGLAFAWLGLLILSRRVRDRLERRREAERRALGRALRDLALGAADVPGILCARRLNLARTAEELAHVANLLRGPEMERVALALRAAGVHDRLLRGAARGRPRRRQVCIEALTAFPGEDTRRALRRVAETAAPDVSLCAWRALFDLGELVRLSDLERDARTARGRNLERLDLAGRIVAQRPEEALPYLRDDRVSDAVRIRLVDCVAASSSPVVSSTLVALAQLCPSPPVRAAAIRGLGRHGCRLGEKVLADALAAPDWEVRAEAASAVALCRAAGLADRLVELLNDEVWLVRYRAGDALTRMAATGLRKLRQVAESGEGRPRRIAHFLLQEMAA